LNTIPPTPDPERAPCQFEECDRYLGLYKRTPRGEMYHVRMMPYQAELHFQCDLLDSARDWVPLAVMEDMARSHAWLKESFINTPPFSCGVPTPVPGGGRRSALCPSIGNGPGVECTTEFECPPARGSSYPLCDKGCCTYRNVRRHEALRHPLHGVGPRDLRVLLGGSWAELHGAGPARGALGVGAALAPRSSRPRGDVDRRRAADLG